MEDRPRKHIERVQFELSQIRAELMEEASRIPPDKLDWAPAAGMKPYRDLLLESAVMEMESLQLMREGGIPDWDTLWRTIADECPSLTTLLSKLTEIRVDTLNLLNGMGENGLQCALPSPQSWNEFFGGPTVEREELFRWIARHEYYHLGQIIAYHWIRGDDPYKRSS